MSANIELSIDKKDGILNININLENATEAEKITARQIVKLYELECNKHGIEAE